MRSASSPFFACGFTCIDGFQYGKHHRSQVRFCAILVSHLIQSSLPSLGIVSSVFGSLLPMIAVETVPSQQPLSPLLCLPASRSHLTWETIDPVNFPISGNRRQRLLGRFLECDELFKPVAATLAKESFPISLILWPVLL